MKKKRFFPAVLLVLIMILVLDGCGKETPKPESTKEESAVKEETKEPKKEDSAESGGVIRKTDPNAPKQIQSKEIASFSVNIYLYGEWSPGREDCTYTFEIKENANGEQTATEATTGVSAAADKELLESLQNIIDEYKLAEKNGFYEVRAGLPPEFAPCTLAVDYESGETLTFTINNAPDGAWEKEIYLAFANWFAGKGENALLPPDMKGPVGNITIVFKDDNTFYRYGVWKVKVQGEEGDGTYSVIRDVYNDEKGESLYDDTIPVPEDYAGKITEIVNAYDLRAFDPYSALYGWGRKEPEEEKDEWEEDLQITIDYEDGHTVNIATSVPEEIESLRPLLTELFAYHNSLFE